MTSEGFRVAFVLIAIITVICVAVSLVGFNQRKSDICKEHGMVMVKDYFGGSYGCGIVIPFDEVQK